MSSLIELHPLCTLFPRLTGAEFDALRDDIKANGLTQPIILHEGMILDGGNRYRACLEAGVEPVFKEFDGGNIVAFVLSANLHRRHMSPGQQAAIVSSAQNWAQAQTHGGDRKTDQSATLHLDTAASRAAASGASLRTQKMADKVAKADPDLAAKVARREISLPKAVEEVAGKTKRSQARQPNPEEMAEVAAEDIIPQTETKPKKKIINLATELAELLNPDSYPEGEEHDALVVLHSALGKMFGDELEMQVDALTRECDRLTEENQKLQAVAGTDLGQQLIAAKEKLLAVEFTRNRLQQENAELRQKADGLEQQLRRLRRDS